MQTWPYCGWRVALASGIRTSPVSIGLPPVLLTICTTKLPLPSLWRGTNVVPAGDVELAGGEGGGGEAGEAVGGGEENQRRAGDQRGCAPIELKTRYTVTSVAGGAAL